VRAQAFAWQAAIARSARAFHEEHGAQHALAMLLPLQASDAAPSPAAAPQSYTRCNTECYTNYMV
jgi:hypothetical protein